MARAGFFYPRLVYNAITIDFDDVPGTPAVGPAAVILLGRETIRGENLAVAGAREVLWERHESTLRLGFTVLPKARLDDLYVYWRDWGSKGKQCAITLDRFGTTAGQWEYDNFNTFFSKAESLDRAFPVARAVPGLQLFTLALNFRQGV